MSRQTNTQPNEQLSTSSHTEQLRRNRNPKVYDSVLPRWTSEASQVSDTNPAIDATVFRRGFGLFPYNAKHHPSTATQLPT